jgi:hypothetical protein
MALVELGDRDRHGLSDELRIHLRSGSPLSPRRRRRKTSHARRGTWEVLHLQFVYSGGGILGNVDLKRLFAQHRRKAQGSWGLLVWVRVGLAPFLILRILCRPRFVLPIPLPYPFPPLLLVPSASFLLGLNRVLSSPKHVILLLRLPLPRMHLTVTSGSKSQHDRGATSTASAD